jgi:hypothetical protein
MPKKRGAKSGRRKLQYGSRQTQAGISPITGGRLTRCVLRSGQIVPDILIVPMKFATVISFNVAGGVGSYVFSQNSAFDPNVTGTGATVAGFTSLLALYERSRVLSSKFKCCPISTDALLAVAIAPSNVNYGTSASAFGVASLRYAKPDIMRFLPAASSGSLPVLRDEVDTTELAGTPLFNAPEYYMLGAADPATQFYWTIAASTIPAGGTATVGIAVEIEYLVEWSHCQDLPA